MSSSAVLLVGGYGAVGAHAARTLRTLHPDLPLVIAGRRLKPAETLARALGHARAITVDLARPDLGLDGDLAINAVAMFVKDSGLNGLRTSMDRAVPYMTISEYAFDIAPAVTRWAHTAGRIAMMLLGHHLGGLATLTALHYAQEFADVSSIRIGAIFDENDLGTATAQADAALAQRVSPHPLRLQAGRWTWANERDTGSTLQAADGTPHPSHSYSLLDVFSIAAASEARDVTFDVAIRPTAADGQPRHEVIIEIDGTRIDQADGPRRFAITDDAHHARLSGQGAALALTHIAGLGNTRAAPPGLHLPEILLGPSATVAQLRALDVNVRPLPDVEAADNRGTSAQGQHTRSAQAEPRGRPGVSEDLCRHERTGVSWLRTQSLRAAAGATVGSSWRPLSVSLAGIGASPEGECRDPSAKRCAPCRGVLRSGGVGSCPLI